MPIHLSRFPTASKFLHRLNRKSPATSLAPPPCQFSCLFPFCPRASRFPFQARQRCKRFLYVEARVTGQSTHRAFPLVSDNFPLQLTEINTLQSHRNHGSSDRLFFFQSFFMASWLLFRSPIQLNNPGYAGAASFGGRQIFSGKNWERFKHRGTCLSYSKLAATHI